MFRSLLQRPKDVVFEGLNEESLVVEVENDEEEEEERIQREVGELLEEERILEREWKSKNEVKVCVCVVDGRNILAKGERYFLQFVVIKGTKWLIKGFTLDKT